MSPIRDANDRIIAYLARSPEAPANAELIVRAVERPAIERDNVDLHKALGEAIKRIRPRDETPRLGFRTDDLLAVLERTARPEDADGH